MDFWYNLQVHKWPSAGWILLYVICLIVLFHNRDKWGDKVKASLIFIGISMVLFLCPLFAKVMVGTLLPSYLEYERMTWLLFIVPVCAFVIVKLLYQMKRRTRKKAVGISLIALLFISNISFISRGYSTAENLLKVPDDVITISEALLDDAGYNDDPTVKPQVLVQEEADNGTIGNWMYHGIRQYTSAPQLTPIYISEEEYDKEDFDILNYGLMNYEYFICSNSENLKEQAEASGYEMLVETDEYVLYKNVKECTVYIVRHGETDANVMGTFAGSGTDAMLTDNGIQQATDTGIALQDITFASAYASELTRAQDTAGIILKHNKDTEVSLTTVSNLNDISWGDIEGMLIEDVYEKYPDYSDDTYIGTLTDTSFVSPIGAESKAYVVSRYSQAMQQIVSTSSEDGNVLVVGHSAMLWWLQTVFGEEVNIPGLNNASITVVQYSKGHWTLKYLNQSATEYEEINQ